MWLIGFGREKVDSFGTCWHEEPLALLNEAYEDASILPYFAHPAKRERKTPAQATESSTKRIDTVSPGVLGCARHFKKMLCDRVQLARVHLHAAGALCRFGGYALCYQRRPRSIHHPSSRPAGQHQAIGKADSIRQTTPWLSPPCSS